MLITYILAVEIGTVGLNAEDDLRKVRPLVDQVLKARTPANGPYKPSTDWHFLDSELYQIECYRSCNIIELSRKT